MKAGEVMEIRPGLTKKLVRPGHGSKPTAGQQVQVHYTGTLEDGRVFDSSRARGQPLKFMLGTSQVVLGWDLGIAEMLVGETAVLTVPPDYGYGNRPTGPIPAGSTLTFEVELMSASDLKPEIPTVFVYGLGFVLTMAGAVIFYFLPRMLKTLSNMVNGLPYGHGH
jgi:FKBP-type peptidyl-prolyl cis-trans isomerase